MLKTMSLNSNSQIMTSAPTSAPTDNTFPSVCIPHTHSSVTWMQVKEVFEHLFGHGSIERVDVVKRVRRNASSHVAYGAGTGRPHRGTQPPHQQEYCKVFVHFKEWPDTPDANYFRQVILSGNCMKIVYNEPWYWKCFKNNSQPRSYNQGAVPYIVPIEPDPSTQDHQSRVVGGSGEDDPVPNTF